MSWTEFKPETKTVELVSTKPWFPHSSIWPRWLRLWEWAIRVKLFGQRSYLIDHWTIEKAEEIECQHGIDLELELTKSFKEELEKEMKENGPSSLEQQRNYDELEKAIHRIKAELDEAEEDEVTFGTKK